MFKLAIGSIVAAIAMLITGFLYFAGPVALAGYASTNDAQSAAVQSALAANLPATGTYTIPNPSTESGTTLYGKGPVATVHYNSKGYSLESMDGMVWGLALNWVAALLMAGALSQLGTRVTDFGSRAKVVVCFALACAASVTLTDPIYMHEDWTYAIFSFVGSALTLCVGGLILARWFMPKAVELAPSVPNKIEEAAPADEIPPVERAGL